MNRTQFSKLNGWVDYDRRFLPQLTYKQRVAWFHRRLNKTLIKPLKYVYLGVSRSKQQSSLLIFATSICCSIEAMGKFYNGGQGTKHAQFKAFIDKFMNSQFSTCTIQDMTYEKVLWKYFRNGLAHGFTICHGGFEHQATYFATKSTADRHILIIDPKSFLDDFLNGINEYLNALNKSSYGETIAQNFQKIFKDVFIDGK